MEDDIEESMFDYLTEFDLESVLPLYWLKCDKDQEALNKKLIDEYQMSDEWLQGEVRDIVIMNYEDSLDEKEFLGWDPNEWPMDGSYYPSDSSEDELDQDALIDIWLIRYFEEEVKRYKEDQAYRQRSSGLFFSVREADGEDVINKAGCLWLACGIFLIIVVVNGAFNS